MKLSFLQLFRTRSGKLGGLLFFGWVANMLACGIVASVLGGDAISGHESAGHYFLGDHGRFTEVSKLIFELSRLHVLSTLISLPFALIGWLLLFFNYSQVDLAAQEQETASRHRPR